MHFQPCILTKKPNYHAALDAAMTLLSYTDTVNHWRHASEYERWAMFEPWI